MKIIRYKETISFCSSKDKPNIHWVKIKEKYYWKIRAVQYWSIFGLIDIPYNIKFGVSNLFWIHLIRNDIVEDSREAKPLYST